ncbi:unnamed protein product [Penicillium salamii]|uniref:Cytochrome P450 n=1 Tax=Penicillium salamii TaxID=1612424 RepID=A0A9W4JFV0_9EURO|nr:unnamed protein product [Penicillium salamii]CAG7984876.1 unnamed protein product [Penicillium salamii]CAG8291545.1 unnamed protein product [Penicillium salamii]CAG8396175.1 unnamed protein product [Penicillium salamii]CAG8400817.1 unnamed protein product [Penicillium salamii]
MANEATFILFSLLICCWVAWKLVSLAHSTRRPVSFPPGPRTLPFLGNLHQIPAHKAFLKYKRNTDQCSSPTADLPYRFQEWSRVYGPIISLKTGPSNLVILNRAKDVRELFDKRGAIYSSRPPNHIGNELITRDNVHLLLMPYGKEWRNQRKIYQAILSISAVRALTPLQEAEATLTISQLAQSSESYYDHIRRYSTAVILSSVFGIRGPEFNHPNITRLYHVQDQFTAILETGATPPIDVFPFLKHLPDFMSPWRRWAQRIRAEQRQLYFELLQEVKSQRKRGIQRNCFMSQLLDEEFCAKHELDEEHIAYIGGVLMEGGSDTTSSTLLSFLLAMVKYPKVFRKAQEEVDRVCGTKESPTFDQLARLPYLKHCVFEVGFPYPSLRALHPLTSIFEGPTLEACRSGRHSPCADPRYTLIPHDSNQLLMVVDDEYNGYKFPTGTTFLANTWAIHHDPELYECPQDFVPERYEANPLGLKPDIQELPDGIRQTYGFGAGRRICPGSHLAENSLSINLAKILWAFDIRAGIDPSTGHQLQGEEVNVDIGTQWTDGFLIAPKPFPIVMLLRSEKHREVLNRDLDEAQKIFQSYED